MLLEGKVALVTGGASGLGRATGKLFAENGARVVLCDVSDEAGEAAAAEIRDGGGDARFVHVDVRKRDDLEAAVAVAEDEFGKLDIAVANAGILGHASFRPSEEITDEDWTDVIEINLGGTFRTFRAAIPALRRAGGGALTATSSVSGVFATVYRAAYSASKAGQNGLVRSLSVELAPDRIRVNSVAAGSMGNNIGQSLGRPRDEITIERPDRSAKSRVVREGRNGALDVAKAHLFLASDLADYISGETIVVDGGFSIWNGT